MSAVDIESDMVDALIGLHAFSGNDFVSSFFRKGKDATFKLVESSSKFKSTFSRLGIQWELSDTLHAELEAFVCKLYGKSNQTDVNQVRYKIFRAKYADKSTAVDMSLLPPCKSVLRLHASRANFVAAVWKRSNQAQVEIPDVTAHGWLHDYSIMWVSDDVYPQEVEDVLLSPEYDTEDVYGDDGDSDMED